MEINGFSTIFNTLHSEHHRLGQGRLARHGKWSHLHCPQRLGLSTLKSFK
jgi:hypothetical protein